MPEKFTTDGVYALGQYVYQKGKIKPLPVDEVAVADAKKASLMSQANSIIIPLQDATDLEMATEAENTQLTL